MFPFLISRLQYNLSQPKILAGFIKGKYLLVSMIDYLVLLTSFPFFSGGHILPKQDHSRSILVDRCCLHVQLG